MNKKVECLYIKYKVTLYCTTTQLILRIEQVFIFYTIYLKCMGTLSGEVTLSFTYLFSFSSGVYSQRKEFAPLGANSFLYE